MPPLLTSILAWLRAGYPAGVPDRDYIPLLALLSRRLAPDEVHDIAERLARDRSCPDGIDKATIGVEITSVTDELPVQEDIDRVRARLLSVGSPLADPFEPWLRSSD